MREPAYVVDLPHVYSGKVRDIYDAGDDRYLMITSDRLSAFDVVMNETVLHKGRVLTAISAFWFEQLSDIAGNHLISTDVGDVPAAAERPAAVALDHARRRAHLHALRLRSAHSSGRPRALSKALRRVSVGPLSHREGVCTKKSIAVGENTLTE